jgi:hypothetical protein
VLLIPHLVDSHELVSGIVFFLVERSKLDLGRHAGLVSEGRLQSVKIMGANSNELPATANILVQLVLQVDERLVGSWGEFYIAQHRSCEEWSDLGGLCMLC